MNITYKLLELPPLVLLSSLIVIFSLFGGLGTWLFRKYVRIKIGESHNDVSGNFFAMIGGFYGLLLAFVVFLVWDQFNEAQKSVDIEASLVKGIYRDISFYPVSETGFVKEADKLEVKASLVAYVKDVITEDSLLSAEGIDSPVYLKYRDGITVKSFSRFFKLIEELHDTEYYKNDRIQQMFHHLNELATYRSLRELTVSSEINKYIWTCLILGGFITALFAMFMNLQNIRFHVTINALLGAFIAIIFYIIILTDHPFFGKMRIDVKSSFGKVLVWEKKGII